MTPKPLRELAEAAAKTATGSGNPLTRNKRRAETLEEQLAELQSQRDRVIKERDALRGQVDTLRRQNDALREQRERGRTTTATLQGVAQMLGVPGETTGPKLRQ